MLCLLEVCFPWLSLVAMTMCLCLRSLVLVLEDYLDKMTLLLLMRQCKL